MEMENKKTWDSLKLKGMTGKALTQIAIRIADISFMNDTDEEIDTADIEEEDWIEFFKRSTEGNH